YCIVRSPQGDVFLLRRSKTGEESRLRDKLSIGVGGHINPVDGGSPETDLVAASCRRELDEELVIEGPRRADPVGIINDESNGVGSVPFGLVFLVTTETARVSVRETQLLKGEFVSPRSLKETWSGDRGRFETWSDLIIAKWPVPGAS